MREVGREVGDQWRTAHAPPTRPAMPPGHPRYLNLLARNSRTVPPQSRARMPSRALQARVRRRVYRLAAAAVVSAGLVFAVLTDGGSAMRPAQPLRAADAVGTIDKALAWAGFGIDQISVTGHRFTLDADILDALDLGTARNWRTFDSGVARNRIERLPWIATATVTRSYPGRLDVRVTERKAFGLWQHGDRATLIDATGRLLSDIRPGAESAEKLPRFKGEGASLEAAAITAIVARHPVIASRLTLAERVAERRWTLHLDNGTSLLLPPDREAVVLDGLVSTAQLRGLMEEPRRVVDLRAPGRIAVRAKPATPASTRAPHTPRIASGGP